MQPMKYVLFRRNGTLHVTPKHNYDAVITNASLLTKLEGFKSFDEVADYMWKYARLPRDYLVDMTCKEDW